MTLKYYACHDKITNVAFHEQSEEFAAHVVKDYINKAKTDMFLPLSES